jgi:hypothetical protein
MNQLEHISRLGDVREIDLGLDSFFGSRGARRLRRALAFGCGLEMRAYLLGFVVLERTGVSFFLGDPDERQHVENRFTFDFQLSCQIVDSNLTHPPSLSPPPCPLHVHVNLTG